MFPIHVAGQRQRGLNHPVAKVRIYQPRSETLELRGDSAVICETLLPLVSRENSMNFQQAHKSP